MKGRSALVLAAGRATRLGPLRDRYAKACVPVAGTSPLAFLLPRLAAAGVEEAWINLHYRGDQVRSAAEQHAPPGLRLRYLREERLLGTGGTLLEASQRLGRSPDLVVNAKVFTDLDLGGVFGEDAPLVVLHAGSSLSEFGGFQFDAEGRVVGHVRAGSPPRDDAAVFTGITRPAGEWLGMLRAARACDASRPLCLVRDALLPALAAGVAPRVLLHRGHWHEISTPARVAAAAAHLFRSLPSAGAAPGG